MLHGAEGPPNTPVTPDHPGSALQPCKSGDQWQAALPSPATRAHSGPSLDPPTPKQRRPLVTTLTGPFSLWSMSQMGAKEAGSGGGTGGLRGWRHGHPWPPAQLQWRLWDRWAREGAEVGVPQCRHNGQLSCEWWKFTQASPSQHDSAALIGLMPASHVLVPSDVTPPTGQTQAQSPPDLGPGAVGQQPSGAMSSTPVTKYPLTLLPALEPSHPQEVARPPSRHGTSPPGVPGGLHE